MEPIIKETTKKMVVELSPDEVAELGLKHAAKRLEWENAKSEKKDFNTDINARIKTLDAEVHRLAVEVNTHKAEREVPVREIFDEDRQMVEYRRLSDDALLPEFTRDFTMQEKGERLQGSLFSDLGEVDPDAPPAADDGGPGDGDEDEGDAAAAAPTDPSELAEPEAGNSAAAESGAPDPKMPTPNARCRVPRGLPPEPEAS